MNNRLFVNFETNRIRLKPNRKQYNFSFLWSLSCISQYSKIKFEKKKCLTTIHLHCLLACTNWTRGKKSGLLYILTYRDRLRPRRPRCYGNFISTTSQKERLFLVRKTLSRCTFIGKGKAQEIVQETVRAACCEILVYSIGVYSLFGRRARRGLLAEEHPSRMYN